MALLQLPYPYSELVPSLGVYAVVLVIGFIFRETFVRGASGTTRKLFLDYMVTFQYVTFTLEAITVRMNFGNIAFIITLFLIGYWIFTFTDPGSSCNPNSHVISWLRREINAQDLVLRVAAQILGGWCAYRFTHDILWMGEYCGVHSARHRSVCGSDLAVTPEYGALIEFCACFFVTLMYFVTMTSYKRTEIYAKCLIEAYITRLGVDYTGLYINPVNASSQTFLCPGSDPTEHFLVYWASPIVATVCAYHVYKWSKRSVKDKRH